MSIIDLVLHAPFRARRTLPLLALPLALAACHNSSGHSSVEQETVSIPSAARPAHSPDGNISAATYPAIVDQFGTTAVDFNHAIYTRYFLDTPCAIPFCGPFGDSQPDAILVLVPGFEGGGASFTILAENLIRRARSSGLLLEVWAFDRRGEQLEDRSGLIMASQQADAQLALDWYFGGELGLSLSPALSRRAIFHDPQAGTAFIATWTPLVFSRDIDAVVEQAREVARDHNVFLGGHSAGTGFAARYAATDFNFSESGSTQPGYAKLRGLVLLEGGAGSTSGTTLSDDSLDRIEDQADGGLFYAVRDNAPRCTDGTACTVAAEASDCQGKGRAKCTPPTFAYSIVPGLLNPRILASGEVLAVQAINDADRGQAILQVDQNTPGNNAIAKVPDLNILAPVIPPSTVEGSFGTFVDDDGFVSSLAVFVRTSVGAPGPVVDRLTTWQDITEGPLPAEILPDNGPAPTSLPGGVWGHEQEVTNFDRFMATFRTGQINFTDWYFPASGLSTTVVNGVCTTGVCTVGNVGAPCAADDTCSQSIDLDSTPLSVGRGRRDIENLTQAAHIDIPVIAFGGSNGLTPIPGSYIPFAQSIGTCTAPSCNGTPRVIDAAQPNPAFPTFGGVDGGFEVHITEGIAHLDIVTAEDDERVNVIGPLLDFIERNIQ